MSYQAIVTKYHPATNVRGSRVSARCDAGRIIRSWDHSLGVEGNHRAVAAELIARLGWTSEFYGEWSLGGLPGAGYVAVFHERAEDRRAA